LQENDGRGRSRRDDAGGRKAGREGGREGGRDGGGEGGREGGREGPGTAREDVVAFVTDLNFLERGALPEILREDVGHGGLNRAA
jgi:hypothetical protein